MTKKEQEPRKNEDEREKHPKDIDYNPDITSEDQEVLNNQSQDEKQGDYFKDREEPIDYAGADLDIPDLDDKKFNQTVNKPDDSETEERPKDSANTQDAEEETETVYKGEEAEKYRDPSKKDNESSTSEGAAGNSQSEISQNGGAQGTGGNTQSGTSENRAEGIVGGDQSETSERQQSRPEGEKEDKEERNRHPRRDGGVL